MTSIVRRKKNDREVSKHVEFSNTQEEDDKAKRAKLDVLADAADLISDLQLKNSVEKLEKITIKLNERVESLERWRGAPDDVSTSILLALLTLFAPVGVNGLMHTYPFGTPDDRMFFVKAASKNGMGFAFILDLILLPLRWVSYNWKMFRPLKVFFEMCQVIVLGVGVAAAVVETIKRPIDPALQAFVVCLVAWILGYIPFVTTTFPVMFATMFGLGEGVGPYRVLSQPVQLALAAYIFAVSAVTSLLASRNINFFDVGVGGLGDVDAETIKKLAKDFGVPEKTIEATVNLVGKLVVARFGTVSTSGIYRLMGYMVVAKRFGLVLALLGEGKMASLREAWLVSGGFVYELKPV